MKHRNVVVKKEKKRKERNNGTHSLKFLFRKVFVRESKVKGLTTIKVRKNKNKFDVVLLIDWSKKFLRLDELKKEKKKEIYK